MGVFSRFLDIVNANINALLDKAEDPEKMIRLMIQEMEDTLIELKSSAAAKMATLAKSKREYNEFEEEMKRWQARAELAISKGREDLAREALLAKRQISERLEPLRPDREQRRADQRRQERDRPDRAEACFRQAEVPDDGRPGKSGEGRGSRQHDDEEKHRRPVRRDAGSDRPDAGKQ